MGWEGERIGGVREVATLKINCYSDTIPVLVHVFLLPIYVDLCNTE